MALTGVASAAVERRKARAPEARASGNIRSRGARPHPLMRPGLLRLSALRLPSWGGTWKGLLGNSVAKLGRTCAPRERICLFTSPRVRGEVEERSDEGEGASPRF